MDRMTVTENDLRTCFRCGETKPLADFYKDRRRPRGSHICKACRNRSQAERHRADPDRRRAANRKWYQANADYFRQRPRTPTSPETRWRGRGILFQGSPLRQETWDQLLALQGGACAICGRKPQTKKLSADHDWVTGEVRGLLDSWCNGRVVPLIEDALRTEDAALLRQFSTASLLGRAVKYVLDPPAQRLGRGADRR